MQVKYPSGLSSFEKIASHAKGKKIVLFLDYDGTLSPIVNNPDRAWMSDSVRILPPEGLCRRSMLPYLIVFIFLKTSDSQMRAAVKEAANCFPTAIISGRCRDKVISFSFPYIDNIFYPSFLPRLGFDGLLTYPPFSRS